MPQLGWNPFEFLDETYSAKTIGMGLLYGDEEKQRKMNEEK